MMIQSRAPESRVCIDCVTAGSEHKTVWAYEHTGVWTKAEVRLGLCVGGVGWNQLQHRAREFLELKVREGKVIMVALVRWAAL